MSRTSLFAAKRFVIFSSYSANFCFTTWTTIRNSRTWFGSKTNFAKVTTTNMSVQVGSPTIQPSVIYLVWPYQEADIQLMWPWRPVRSSVILEEAHLRTNIKLPFKWIYSDTGNTVSLHLIGPNGRSLFHWRNTSEGPVYNGAWPVWLNDL